MKKKFLHHLRNLEKITRRWIKNLFSSPQKLRIHSDFRHVIKSLALKVIPDDEIEHIQEIISKFFNIDKSGQYHMTRSLIIHFLKGKLCEVKRLNKKELNGDEKEHLEFYKFIKTNPKMIQLKINYYDFMSDFDDIKSWCEKNIKKAKSIPIILDKYKHDLVKDLLKFSYEVNADKSIDNILGLEHMHIKVE